MPRTTELDATIHGKSPTLFTIQSLVNVNSPSSVREAAVLYAVRMMPSSGRVAVAPPGNFTAPPVPPEEEASTIYVPVNCTGHANAASPAPFWMMRSRVSVFPPDAMNCIPPSEFNARRPMVVTASTVISAALVTISSSAAVNAPAGAGDQLAAVERLPLAPPIHVYELAAAAIPAENEPTWTLTFVMNVPLTKS